MKNNIFKVTLTLMMAFSVTMHLIINVCYINVSFVVLIAIITIFYTNNKLSHNLYSAELNI